MARPGDTQPLTQLEFTEDDFPRAEKIARALGYTQTVYTSTSSLYGLFCLRDCGDDRKMEACIINTRELGMLYVVLEEDVIGRDGKRVVA